MFCLNKLYGSLWPICMRVCTFLSSFCLVIYISFIFLLFFLSISFPSFFPCSFPLFFPLPPSSPLDEIFSPLHNSPFLQFYIFYKTYNVINKIAFQVDVSTNITRKKFQLKRSCTLNIVFLQIYLCFHQM